VTTEGCDLINTVEQKSFVDQGGTLNPRDRFGGGETKNSPGDKRYGSLKAIDPTTGETKNGVKLPYPPYGGVLATAGNLVYMGQVDGQFTAYDARTLQEVWSINVGTGINAPPITYSVNGKQYIAILVGSRERQPLLADAPELKNLQVTSMLY